MVGIITATVIIAGTLVAERIVNAVAERRDERLGRRDVRLIRYIAAAHAGR
jgi:hypothetical protein